MCHIQITDIVRKQIDIDLNPKPQRYIRLSQLERESLVTICKRPNMWWYLGVHAACKSAHIPTPHSNPFFHQKNPQILEKAPKQCKLKVGYLWLHLASVFVPFLLPCGIPYHHASSEQSKDNVTCFLLPCGIPCTMHHAPMHHPSKAKPMSHAFGFFMGTFSFFCYYPFFFFLIHNFLKILIK